MICTWNHTIAHNEKDLKQGYSIHRQPWRITHTHINPFTCATLQYLHLHSWFFPVILSWGYWKLPSAPLFSPLSFLFSPLLLWLIKSPALWYTAKPPGHFYGLLGPLFLSSFHRSFLPSYPLPPFVRNERCNTLHSCNPGSIIFFFSHNHFIF